MKCLRRISGGLAVAILVIAIIGNFYSAITIISMTQSHPAQLPIPAYLNMALWHEAQKLTDQQYANTNKETDATTPHDHQEVSQKLLQFTQGMHRYNRSLYQRSLPTPDVIWKKGSCTLVDYAPNQPSCPIVLFVPSLINRSYILDITQKRSILRYLAQQDLHPILLDWGDPGPEEFGLSVNEYVTHRLDEALSFVSNTRQPIILAGYCMGGLMALASAIRNPDIVHGLSLLATPWDFQAKGFIQLPLQDQQAQWLAHILDYTGFIPKEMVQTLFTMLHPAMFASIYDKFSSQQDYHSESFMTIEHWINDGVAVTSHAIKQCVMDFGKENQLLHHAWDIHETIIDPSSFTRTSFTISPTQDTIVPPASMKPLIEALPNNTVLRPNTGHIGMVVGKEARNTIWEPFATWVKHITR